MNTDSVVDHDYVVGDFANITFWLAGLWWRVVGVWRLRFRVGNVSVVEGGVLLADELLG